MHGKLTSWIFPLMFYIYIYMLGNECFIRIKINFWIRLKVHKFIFTYIYIFLGMLKYIYLPNFPWTSKWLTHLRPITQASDASELLSWRPAIWAQAVTPCSNVEQLQDREGMEFTSESRDIMPLYATQKASISPNGCRDPESIEWNIWFSFHGANLSIKIYLNYHWLLQHSHDP